MTETPKSRTPRAGGRDPALRLLTYLVLAALVCILALGVYIAFEVLGASKAPRTAVERNILMLEAVVKEKPKSAEAWGDYIKSLTEAKQFGRAGSVLEEAYSVVGTTTAVQVEEVRLLQARGRSRQALDLSERVVAVAYSEKEQKVTSARAAGITAGYSFPHLVDILVIRGGLLADEGRHDEALKAYDAALKEDPTMADVLIARGEVRLATGDTAGARKDFEAALEMLPDDARALEGLEKTKTEGEK